MKAGPLLSISLSETHVKNSFPPRSNNPAGVPSKSELRGPKPNELTTRDPNVVMPPFGIFINNENST